VVRKLSPEYYVVQCNAFQLQVDDLVVLSRNGMEIGRGQVMRQQGAHCSIRLLEGQAERFDLVCLASRKSAPGDRGPELGGFVAAPGPAQQQAQARPAAVNPSRDGYFQSMNFSGRVYQLNTGQVLTP